MEELIILGNGFDIGCGLKSRYADFYNYRYTNSFLYQLDNLLSSENRNREEINFWDIILASPDIENVIHKNWQDIESILAKYLDMIRKQDAYLEQWIKYYNDVVKEQAPVNKQIDIIDHFVIVGLARISNKKYNRAFNSKKISADERQSFIADILMDELKKYEGAFKEYLSQEIEKSEEYIARCNQQIDILISADKYKQDVVIPSLKVKILSFNYTKPFQISAVGKINGLKNVHGSLDKSNIVFGIDEFSEAATEFVKFTKTYRTLAMTKEYGEKLYSKDLRTIKFFGHSLGEADYSYFQSIFDGIDLYGSDVKVIFYYSRFHENESDNNREEEIQYQRITKLFKRYGETRGNSYHGKNLMHKLILEGRISIVDI